MSTFPLRKTIVAIILTSVIAFGLARVGGEDATSWYLQGSKLEREEVANLEKQVAKKPDDLASRIKIIGAHRRHFIFDAKAREAMQPHILWIIRHLPAHEAAGRPFCMINARIDAPLHQEQAKAWEEQLAAHPSNVNVLSNAAQFYTLANWARSKELLEAAKKLEPKNPEWNKRLGFLYTLQSQSPLSAKSSAKQAFEAYQLAVNASTGENRFYMLDDLAKAALKAGETAAARSVAQELLAVAPDYKSNWNYGNAIYSANSVLGLIALEEGDLAAARNSLLAAGDTPGSPQLDSFGPDLALAQALLDRGEGETVVAFLEKISKFWQGREELIRGWQKAIKAGAKPSLG